MARELRQMLSRHVIWRTYQLRRVSPSHPTSISLLRHHKRIHALAKNTICEDGILSPFCHYRAADPKCENRPTPTMDSVPIAQVGQALFILDPVTRENIEGAGRRWLQAEVRELCLKVEVGLVLLTTLQEELGPEDDP